MDLLHTLPREELRDYVGSSSGVANVEPGPREEMLDRTDEWTTEEVVELPFLVTTVLGRSRGLPTGA